MIKTKTIIVQQPSCDVCEKPTTRSSYRSFLFCNKHKWISEALNWAFSSNKYDMYELISKAWVESIKEIEANRPL